MIAIWIVPRRGEFVARLRRWSETARSVLPFSAVLCRSLPFSAVLCRSLPFSSSLSPLLTELRIRNFAIIDAVVLPLAPGLNVLSGETGAGKSIIVGALGLLVGERATADLVRPGADRAVVEGTFELGDAPAHTTRRARH
jgi:hypothetical protein